MLQYFILALILYVVCSAIFGSADRKDEKRWPYLMRQKRESRRVWRKYGIASSKSLAARLRRHRAKARKDEKWAKILDEVEAETRQAYYDDLPRRQAARQAADMEQKMADMQRKIDDLERETRCRY